MDEAKAIIVVQEAAIATALEFALLAAGLTPVVCNPRDDLDRLPLDAAMVVIVGPTVLGRDPAGLVARLRSRGWLGPVILITGDSRPLRGVFKEADQVAVLEMPFVAADLIAAIRSFGQG